MQLGGSNSIDATTLLGFTRFLTNTKGNVNAFSDADIKALLNLRQRTLQTRLLAALNFDWKENTVDGTGNGSINMVAGTNTIAFPTGMLQIDRMELNYSGVPNSYVPVHFLPIQAYTPYGLANLTTANPSVIGSAGSVGNLDVPVATIRNKVITIDPVPNLNVTAGIKIWGQTLITDLSASTDAPVFEAAFHEILAYESAETWSAMKGNINVANRLMQIATAKFVAMVEFYSNRVDEEQARMQVPLRDMI